MIMAGVQTEEGDGGNQNRCNHPDHRRILEKYSMKEKEVKNFIDTPAYGKICVICWSHEVGEYIERHPVSSRDL